MTWYARGMLSAVLEELKPYVDETDETRAELELTTLHECRSPPT